MGASRSHRDKRISISINLRSLSVFGSYIFIKLTLEVIDDIFCNNFWIGF